MTIVSKEGASTSGPSDSKSDSNYQAIEAISGPPPSYADVQASGSSSAEATFGRPTNFMSVNKTHGPIKDIWVIDTGLKVPDALLPSMGIFGSLRTRPNLNLYTGYGSINATIFLVSSASKRAFLKADSQSGHVTLQVSRLGSKQAFKLTSSTKVGTITFGLPRDYVGPVRYKTPYGKTTFSPELKRNILETSGENGFVGNFDESGFVDYRSWEGDEIELETGYGSISLMYIDELEAEGPSFQEKVEDTVNNVLGWFGLRK